MNAHDLFTLGLTVLIAVLAYWIKRYMDSNDRMHADHYRHSTDMSLHELDRERDSIRANAVNARIQIVDELKSHTQMDDRRFDKLETKMDGMADDIKEILKAVGK
jgi:hypothetical protein